MQHITDLTARHLIDGILGRYIHGDRSTLGLVEITKGAILPLHHHPHEQITFILEGELEMTIGGETMTLKPGDFHVITSNTPHSAVAHMDCKLIDVFAPVREDYRT
jgi:quercetin dioxygenase-like cupin family protein